MNEVPLCQSCSMPLEADEHCGTEADGSLSKTYCIHCFRNGEFTQPDATLEDMVKAYTPNWGKWIGKPDMPADEASAQVRAVLSKLERWKNQA